jgi:hypothetical protein
MVALMDNEAVIECPCCHGDKHLMVHSEEYKEDPPYRAPCIHCGGNGVIAVDQRSMNQYE